jgi:lipopolysaccharide biosynthesis glycosyltransferase
MVLVCGADDNYAIPLAVTLHSALVNLDDEGPVELYVVDGGLSAGSKRRLERVVDAPPPHVDLHWRTVDMSRLEGLPTHEWINTTTYLRLLIPDIVPARHDRALYLDSDLQVEASLTDLWAHSFDGHALAATRAYGTPYVSSPLGIEKYRELGYAPETPYFNAGVLLFNLDRWRTEALSERVLQYLRDYHEHVQMVDQEALNAVLADDWAPLDLKWNVMSHLVNFDDWDDSPFKERVRPRREELLDAPYIYHFAGGSKPWQIACNHPAQLEWIGYLWECPWFSAPERLRWFGEWMARYSWFRTKTRLGVT